MKAAGACVSDSVDDEAGLEHCTGFLDLEKSLPSPKHSHSVTMFYSDGPNKMPAT